MPASIRVSCVDPVAARAPAAVDFPDDVPASTDCQNSNAPVAALLAAAEEDCCDQDVSALRFWAAHLREASDRKSADACLADPGHHAVDRSRNCLCFFERAAAPALFEANPPVDRC